MCGIVGMWSRERCDKQSSAATCDAMLSTLKHRGPDDGGFAVDDNVCLGNRRLKIFDLSESGNQPFFSEDGSLWLILNGEIYNHYELREQLEPDFRFHSSSDTEVLLRAFEKWGITCFQRLNGMFAFAIWNQKSKELILCRDRLGIKPLYYWMGEEKLYFASEIKALLAAGISAEPNLPVFRDYLIEGFYDHTHQTFFRNIFQLNAGHYITMRDGEKSETRYWDVAEKIHGNMDRRESAENDYFHILHDAIRLRMRSDVPYAVMLSGGLDSSVLAHIADGNLNGKQLNVCTFRSDQARYDEGPWADLAVHGRDWIRHNVTVDEKMVEDLLPLSLWHQDEPFGGVATFADVLLSEIARSHGIYVLLEGQGADETLGGYEYYFFHYLFDVSQINDRRARSIYKDYAALRELENTDDSYHAFILKGRESRRMSQDGTVATNASGLSGGLLDHPGTGFTSPEIFRTRFENSLFRDLFYTKVPRVLRFKDRASMMNGVELRVPFLDHRLVELCFAILPERKLNNGYTKAFLRETVADYLPHDTCYHVKRQVQTPQREWLRGLLKDFVNETIHSSSFQQRGLFIPQKVAETYQAYVDYPERYPNSFFIWQWIMIEWWFRIFIDKRWQPPDRHVTCERNIQRYPKDKAIQ